MDWRATSRRTGLKPLTTIMPGVSSTITSTPVAFSKARILRPSRSDDTALHVIIGDFNGRNGHFTGLFGGVALDGSGDDLTALGIRGFRGPPRPYA